MPVLHLTVELLRLRVGTDAVPVLLSAAGWDPTQPLENWIADRLTADNRPLGQPVQAPDGTRRTWPANSSPPERSCPSLTASTK
jgi:hypothetical protein